VVELKKTLCNRDCPDVCSIVATVEDGRVTRLQGDKQHPITRGFLCKRIGWLLIAGLQTLTAARSVPPADA